MTAQAKPPVHFWLIAAASLLWNAMGAYDYTMTQTRNTAYLEGFSADTIAWIDSFPVWAMIAWAVGVWGSVLGSVLLLARSRLAVAMFLVSFAGALASMAYQHFGSAMPDDVRGFAAAAFSLAILLVVAALWRFSAQARRKGWLR
ncbi:MAG: hypothetical protein WCY11_16000 [Novosphingobium sp.]